MSDTNMINLKLNEDMIKPVLEKQIQAAVLANIGEPEALIEKVVSLALKQKVNENGKVDSYSSRNNFDFLELITAKAIRNAAEDALHEWLEENTQLVKAMVIREMNKPERQNSLVKTFADAVETSLKCSWNFHCNIKFEKKEL